MIVADASWVIALRDPSDPHHGTAVNDDDTIDEGDVVLHQVTLAECLVGAARLGMVEEAAATLRAAFEILDADVDAPLRWAQVRADHALRLPDAVVVDTAVSLDAAIVTFDERLRRAALRMGLPVFSAS